MTFSRRPGPLGRFNRRGIGTPAGAVALVAPEAIATTTKTFATSGTTRTLDLSSLGLRKGDWLEVHLISRVTDAGAALVITPPASQGWSVIEEFVGASFANGVYRKKWGEDGQTDTLAPVFTTSIGGTWGVSAGNIRGSGGVAQSADWTLTASSNTQTAPLLATPPATTSLIRSLYSTTDDNALNAPSRGTLWYGDAAHNLSTIGSIAGVYEVGVDASVSAASVTESANGPDVGRATTVEWSGLAAQGGNQTSTFSTDNYGRATTSGTGWRSAAHIHPRPIGGLLYEHMVVCSTNPLRSLTIGYRTSVPGSGTWSAWTTFNTGAIADPVGITNWYDDPHFTPTIGLDGEDNIWVFFLAHGNESAMQYLHSTGGPTDISSLTAASAAVWTPPAAWLKAPASYPRLDNIPSDGTLVLLARDGTPGNDATFRMFEHSTGTTWLDATPSGIMDWAAGGGDEESPYMDQVVFDVMDALHCSFMWCKTNVTNAMHDKHYFTLTRSSPGTWVAKDVAGTTLTMPFDQTKGLAATIPLNTGTNVNCGIGLNSDNTPLLPYFKADGADTRMWLAMYVGGAWVQRDLGLCATGWNLVDAPPASEYGLCRTPTAFYRNGVITVVWSCDQTVGPGGLPYFVAKSSSDNGVTWSAAFRLINEETGNWLPRYDGTALYYLGILHFPWGLLDSASNFGNPLTTPVFVTQIN